MVHHWIIPCLGHSIFENLERAGRIHGAAGSSNLSFKVIGSMEFCGNFDPRNSRHFAFTFVRDPISRFLAGYSEIELLGWTTWTTEKIFFSREMVSSFFWGGPILRWPKKKGVQEKTVSFFFQNHDPLMRYLSTINWLVAFVLRHQGSACESRGQALNRWSRLWSNIRLEACYVPLHFSKSS